jgi:signal transduction histidine kinase
LKHSVEELGDANSDLHNLMAASAIATIFLDSNLRITRFTPPALQLFHLIQTDIGRPLTDLQHRLDYPALDADARAALTRLMPVEREVGLSGARGWYLARWVPYYSLESELAGVVVTMVELTELKEARLDLEASQEKLLTALRETEEARATAERAVASKDQFLAKLSHELRTPLSPILMGIRLLQREEGATPRVTNLLAMMQRNVEQETRLIDELLDVTRIVHDKLELDRHPLDLHDLIRTAVAEQEDALTRRHQEVRLDLNATLCQVDGDHDRLTQAIWNLLQNASKFSEDGEPITITSEDGPGHIAVTVSDQGIGISPDDMAAIFEPFAQRASSTVKGGLGLGLSIVRSIIAAHEGQLEATSPGTGLGARFTFTLPLSQEATP